MRPRIGFAGMTHLGLNSAVAAAVRGYEVFGYDADAEHCANLAAGRPHVVEPDLERLMAEQADHLHFTAALGELARCPLVYIAPDVPTDDQANSDLSGLRALIAAVDAALPTEIVLVLLSQVPPGFCRGLRLRPGRPLYYQVETLIFGQAIERALYPERFILGCAAPDQPLPQVLQDYLESYGCPRLPMRYESAELAKISINCCLVASITIANTLAELCEHSGADWREIVPALKLDKRIGPHSYLAPGLGIAGGNLERDLNTVIRLADQHGSDARTVQAWVANSTYRKNWVLRLLHQRVLGQLPQAVIAVWGLAYKPNTHSLKGSPALALLPHLRAQRVQAYDPVVPVAAVGEPDLVQASDALAACDGADVLVIMTPWPQFATQPVGELARRMRGTYVIDPYHVLSNVAVQAEGLTHFGLGAPLGDPHADPST